MMAFDALCLVAGGAKVIYDFHDCGGEQFGGYVASVIPRSNPEGCEKAAGGRSVAETPGKGFLPALRCASLSIGEIFHIVGDPQTTARVSLRKRPILREIALNSPITGRDPIDLGRDSIDLGSDSIDLGRDPIDLGRDSIDLGRDPIDLGRDSIELGRDPIDLSRDPIDLGRDPIELGHDPIELGRDPIELGRDSIDLGCDSSNLERDSMSFGHDPINLILGSKCLGPELHNPKAVTSLRTPKLSPTKAGFCFQYES
jgi:hypothetical protein